MDLLKKHAVDYILFLGVIAVFFLSGTSKPKLPKPSTDTETIASDTNSQVTNNEPSNSNPPTNIESPPNVPPPNEIKQAPANINPDLPAQSANPYAALMNRNITPENKNDNIQNSLKNLKGEAPSTEALIERNAYFKKLSDQLKDLQGNVSTDEEKPSKSNDQSLESTGPTDEEDELDSVEAEDGPGSDEPTVGPE